MQVLTIRSNIASKIIVLFPFGRRSSAQMFIASFMRWFFFDGDCFDLFEWRQFVESSLVVEDVIEEVLQIFLVEGLLQLAEQFLALVNDHNNWVSHAHCA